MQKCRNFCLTAGRNYSLVLQPFLKLVNAYFTIVAVEFFLLLWVKELLSLPILEVQSGKGLSGGTAHCSPSLSFTLCLYSAAKYRTHNFKYSSRRTMEGERKFISNSRV